jgi:hypothetical protein
VRQLTRIPTSSDRRPEPAPPRPRVPPSSEGLNGAFQPCAPGALVRIYTMEREWGMEYWLCPAAVEVMTRDKWSVRKHRAPPFDDLPCYVHGRECPSLLRRADALPT